MSLPKAAPNFLIHCNSPEQTTPSPPLFQPSPSEVRSSMDRVPKPDTEQETTDCRPRSFNQRTFTGLLAQWVRGAPPPLPSTSTSLTYEEEAATGSYTHSSDSRPASPLPCGYSSHGSSYQERCFRSFRAKHILSAIPSKRDRNTGQGRSPISVSDTNCTPILTDSCGCFSAICSKFRGPEGLRLDRWHPLNLYRPDPGSTITSFKGFWSQ